MNNIEEPYIGVRFWGVRGSTPCADAGCMEYGGNTTCMQIKLPGSEELLILDSGTGIRELGNEVMGGKRRLRGRLFITHPHWDHIQGFPFFKPFYNDRNTFSIHMPMQASGPCRGILSGHMMDTYFPVTPEMLRADMSYITQDPREQTYGNYSVSFMSANHHTNTAIYKIKISGRVIVFAPDNEIQPVDERKMPEFHESLARFIKGADLLIHDGQYCMEAYPARRNWGHTAWEVAAEFAARAKVKSLFLTHHDPDSSDAYLDSVEEELQERWGKVFDLVGLAREGVTVQFDVGQTPGKLIREADKKEGSQPSSLAGA